MEQFQPAGGYNLAYNPRPGFGAYAANPSPAQTSGPLTAFASMSLHLADRIRFIRFPEHDIDRIRDAIASSWPKGIQEERIYDESYEFKLYGFPWRTSVDKLEARQLMIKLLASLYAMGWILKLATTVTKKETSDKDSMIFSRRVPPSPPALWTCVSFERHDKLRIIDGSQELAQALRNRFIDKIRSTEMRGACFDIKFNSISWNPYGTETVKLRIFVMTLLEILENCGFSVYAAICHESSGGTKTDLDTWYCIRQSNWRPGVPVYY